MEQPNNKLAFPFPAHEKPKFTFIDLFAGIRGFRMAMQNLGGMRRECNLVIDDRLTDFTSVANIKGEVNRQGWRKMTYKDILWKLVEENTETKFSSDIVDKFLNSIHIHKPKSPAQIVSKFCGGTVDVVIETKDRSGINRILGFSCKSDLKFSSTLLNASVDNANLVYEVIGDIDDEKMVHFNSLFKVKKKRFLNPENPTGEKIIEVQEVATADRMSYMHQIRCDPKFVDTVKPLAKANLIKCSVMEMPAIIGGMLKKFYYENLTRCTTMENCIEYLADNDFVGYGFDDLQETYRGKIAHSLLCTFIGMRLGSKWNGRQKVNGGYIVVKNDGDVVAFHFTIVDEFKDFLVTKMIMESPSHSRHRDMVIYKEGDCYFLKLGLYFVLHLINKS